jgi:hypothetical protein
VISRNPATLQLRYLQTLLEMGVNQNTTIVFPLPIDLIKAFVPNSGPATTAPPGLEDTPPPKPPPDPDLTSDEPDGPPPISRS